MEHGVLDKVTLDVERFEVWVTDKVTPLSPADALLIQQLAKCVHLARMRALDEAGTMSKRIFLAAKQSVTASSDFL